MNALFEAAREVGDFMTTRGWSFCVIGGLAVQRWGEPRTTLDADITVLAEWGREKPIIDALLKRFEARLPDAGSFALEHRVLLIKASNDKDIDVTFGALPFEVEMVRRAVQVEFAPGVVLPCCTAEDLFVMKVFAGRPRDWVDAASIVTRQVELDDNHIRKQLRELADLKEDPGLMDKANDLLSST